MCSAPVVEPAARCFLFFLPIIRFLTLILHTARMCLCEKYGNFRRRLRKLQSAMAAFTLYLLATAPYCRYCLRVSRFTLSAHFYFLLSCLPLAAVFLPTWCILTQWVWKLCMSSHKTVYVSSCVGVCCICQLHSCRVIIRLTPWRVALKCCCNFNTI